MVGHYGAAIAAKNIRPQERKVPPMRPTSSVRALVIGFLGLVILGPAVRAAEPEWKVGLAQVKITPERPLFLAGYASRNRPFDKVESDLYAKALALEDREGHRVVLVTSDLIGFSAAVAEPICERLREKAGLKRE